MTRRLLDLGVSDVHTDAVEQPKKKKKRKLTQARVTRISAKLGAGGSLHVRHMSDARGELATLGVIELASNDNADTSKPVWIQLAKPGSFRGHAAGPFTLDAAVFSQVLSNFKSTANRHIPIDFNHASEQDPTAGSLPVEGAPAQGWIVDMKIEGGNLWGLVQWGELARQYIREGGYRYFSPAIRFNSRDRVTGQPVGARMSSGALTNDPFLDGLMPVAASNVQAPVVLSAVGHSSETLPRIRRALKLSDLASSAECSAEFGRLCDAVDMGGGEDVDGMPVRDRIASLRTEMNAPLTQPLDEFLEQIESILDEAQDGGFITDIPQTDSSGAPMAALEDDASGGDADAGAMTMSDQATLLSQAQGKVSELTLQLSAATAEAEASKKTISERDATIVELQKQIDARAEVDLTAEVDAAILTWGERKGINAASKPHLLAFRKASPDGFKAMYPEEDAVRTRLMSRVTPPVKRDAPAGAAGDGIELVDGENFTATLSRVRAAYPKMTAAAAYDRTYALRNG